MEHLLTTLFIKSYSPENYVIFSRSGVFRKYHLFLTGIMALASQCCILPWVIILITRSPGIKGPLGDVTPVFSVEWWILFVIILTIYPISLWILGMFFYISIIPFYQETIVISNSSLCVKKSFFSIPFIYNIVVWNNINNIKICYDEKYQQKYYGIFPYPNEKTIQLYPQEYNILLSEKEYRYFFIHTIFIDEVNEIVNEIRSKNQGCVINKVIDDKIKIDNSV
jgi:hypothetical protein